MMWSKCFALVAGAAFLTFSNTPAIGQSWPAKPIRMIVGYAAGGGTDAAARGIAPRLSEVLGQPVVVENRPGANGVVGAELVASAAPDGHTLYMGAAGTMVIAPHLTAKLPFDTFKSFVPVSLAANSPFIVSLAPGVPANSIAELIELARKQPGRIIVGSSGNGGAPHLATELFKAMARVDLVHVPYKGLAPAITDLMGGQIQVVFADVGLVRSQVASGKLKGLAITSLQRASDLPNLPTVAESGLPGFEAGTWYGVFAPAGTPSEVVDRLASELSRVLSSEAVRLDFTQKGMLAAPTSPQEFSRMVRSEFEKWGKLIRDAQVKAD
jgi:tripartite-type tricarboxylate transporter receptor subunit TctC